MSSALAIVIASPLVVAAAVWALLWVLRYFDRRADARRQAAADRLDRWVAEQEAGRVRERTLAVLDAASAAFADGTDTAVLPTSVEGPGIAGVRRLYPPRLISVDELGARHRHPTRPRPLEARA